MRFCKIHPRAISEWVPKLLFCVKSLKVIILKWLDNYHPDTNGLNISSGAACLKICLICGTEFNSLAPGKVEWNFTYLILQIISVIDSWCISCELALRWMSLDLTDDKWTLVQVMAWCRQEHAITWAYVYPDLCGHMASLGPIELLIHVAMILFQDYFRAAMTCIKHFYQAGAGSYAVLFQRVKHLHDAKQHLESYLEQQQWGALNIHCSRAPSGAEHSFRMIRSPTEVNKWVICMARLDCFSFHFFDRLITDIEGISHLKTKLIQLLF